MTTATTVSAQPLTGLYAFVRDHLSVFNGVMLASGTLVAVLDFLGPRFSVLPKIVYSATLAIVLLMIAAAFAPALVGRILAAVGLTAGRDDLVPLWRKPLWQITIVLLSVVTVVGFASVARANQGGLLASNSTSVKSWQDAFLSLKADVAEVGSGVRDANAKLDRVVAVLDPDQGADSCTDLMCALPGGASSATVRRIFAKGARVPGNPIGNAVLLQFAASSRGQGRLETVDLLFQHGIPRDLRFLAHYTTPGDVPRDGLRWAREVEDLTGAWRFSVSKFDLTGNEDLAIWNEVQGCFLRTSGGVTLLELAALRGDGDLAAHLIAGGSKLSARPLSCKMQNLPGMSGAGSARVEIDPRTGKVLGVKRV